MNKVILMGRLTKDPDVKYVNTANGSSAVARYSLAVDRRYKKDGEQTADFINCVAFGKLGEFAEKYLRKGTKIAVEGRIQTGSYKNKDGVTVHTTDIIVESQEFAESRNSANTGSFDSQSNSTGFNSGNANTGDFMSIPAGVDDESLPFN